MKQGGKIGRLCMVVGEWNLNRVARDTLIFE